jgi:hypothetical protein
MSDNKSEFPPPPYDERQRQPSARNATLRNGTHLDNVGHENRFRQWGRDNDAANRGDANQVEQIGVEVFVAVAIVAVAIVSVAVVAGILLLSRQLF